jgi:hypothetical protein
MTDQEKKIKEPKIGDKIYVGSAMYLSHGRDDFAGGLATISKIERSKTLPTDHPNYMFVSIKERPSASYNWKHLLAEQSRLKKEYKGKVAHPDPDYAESSNQDD